MVARKVTPDTVAIRSPSGEDGRSRGRTHPARRVALSELHSLRRELVEVRSLDQRVAIGRRVTPSHVVSEEDDDVGTFGLLLCGEDSICKGEAHKNANPKSHAFFHHLTLGNVHERDPRADLRSQSLTVLIAEEPRLRTPIEKTSLAKSLAPVLKPLDDWENTQSESN